jgi:SPP1 gp7 family putative phage head morphogenesis protein
MEDWREGIIAHLEAGGEAGLAQWQESVQDDEALASALFRTRLQADMAGQLFVRAVEVPETDVVGQQIAASTRALQDSDARPSFMRLAFEEALDSFLARGLVTQAQYREMIGIARRDSFSAVNLASDQLVSRARDLIQRHLAEGGSVRSFVAGMRDGSIGLGIEPATPHYIENVFRTNVQSAYGAGRLRQLEHPAVAAARPFVQYRTAGDNRVRPNHAALEGVVFNRAEDPGWREFAPPLGFQCRCALRAVRASQVDKVTLSSDIPEGVGADPGWTGPGVIA